LRDPDNQEWFKWAALNLAYVTVSALWVLAFVRKMWDSKPRTWFADVVQLFWKSLVVYLVSAFTFFWILFFYAVTVLLAPIVTLNLFGMAWALAIGTLHWKSFQESQKLPPNLEPTA
jgi:hypothetical protein